MGRLLAALAIALSGAGCIHDDLVACGNLLCSPSEVCSPAGDACVRQDQIDACDGMPEGAPCTPASSAPGTCQGGVCVQYCGDGVVEAGEQCDDGNQNPSDGCNTCMLATWAASAVIGGSTTAGPIGTPTAVRFDAAGNAFFTDIHGYRIERIDAATGVVTVAAGNGTQGFSGDGGPATGAMLDGPSDVGIDGFGNLFIADGNRIRRIDAATGVITTIAGTGVQGFSGDGGPASAAELWNAAGVAIDGLGNVYVSDSYNSRVRRIDATTGVIDTIAGDGGFGETGSGGPAVDAELQFPNSIVIAADSAVLFVSGSYLHRIDPATGILTTLAGSGGGSGNGDGGPAGESTLSRPSGVALDRAGDIYIADAGDNRIRRIDATTGIITTVAGTGSVGNSGDGGSALAAQLDYPSGVAVDRANDIEIADYNNLRIRRVDAATSDITTVAGNGQLQSNGDGGSATSAQLSYVQGIGLDATGNLLIADLYADRIRRVDATTGVITTIGGGGGHGYAGDGGLATAAELAGPWDVAADPAGNIYIADGGNQRIRRIDGATGVITTCAGNGTANETGNGGPAVDATVNYPQGIATDAAGNVYFEDEGAATVRMIASATGMMSVAVGNGATGFSGDAGPALAAELRQIYNANVDAAGNIYVADTGNNRIRRVDGVTSDIETIAGSGTAGFAGDGAAATSAELMTPYSAAADSAGNVYIADSNNVRVRRIDAQTGIITTLAGTGVEGFSGDGGLASGAELNQRPADVAIDAAGNVFIADPYNTAIRRVDADTGVITTVAGAIDPLGMGPIPQARLFDPQQLVVVPGQALAFVAGGTSGTVQAMSSTAVRVVAGRYPQPTIAGPLARYRDASFGTVSGVAYDAAGGVFYLTESSANRIHAVRMVDPANVDTWTIAPLAGAAGTAGYLDGAATSAMFRNPTGLYLDAVAHVLYVADTGNHVIRAIDLTSNMVTTAIGTGATRGFAGDGGPATGALLYSPKGIVRCTNGDFFVADTGNQRIRRVDGTGAITTVLGDGTADSSGTGAPAATFTIDTPNGLGCDVHGNVYATSRTVVRELAADGNGVVDGTGAVLTIYGAAPRATFPASITTCLTGLAVIDDATLQLTDSCTGLLVELVRQ